MTVEDPRVPSGMTDMYRSGGYNPSTYSCSDYTSGPSYSSAKKEETLPDWVVNNNKVTISICYAVQLFIYTPSLTVFRIIGSESGGNSLATLLCGTESALHFCGCCLFMFDAGTGSSVVWLFQGGRH